MEVFKGLLVSIGWMFYSDGDTISMYQPIKKELHGNMRLYIEKQIVFQSNTLDIAYYIKQNQIESEILGLKKLTYPLDADQVIETLLIFNSKTICQGGPLMNDFPGKIIIRTFIHISNTFIILKQGFVLKPHT